VAIKRNEQDERANEYRRTFVLRAIMGGAFRAPVSSTKRVLVVHGSTRALNEFVRGDTAHSILAVLARDIQADVLVTGHAASSFRRDAHGVTFVGVGPVDGPGVAEFAIVNVGSIEALRASGLPPGLAAQSEGI
jgi:predicted phosphodiesterase